MHYSFEKLEIWRLEIQITKAVYCTTKKFPREELWGITSQMRRAAASIPLNVAEGSSRKSKKDFSLFLRRAIGSLLELLTALEIAVEEKYVPQEDYEILRSLCQEEYFKIIAFEKRLLQ
ncbi:MAG: four helix bundle protein [Candidatus Sungbacteria bacterium]|uniref:Four helix bundle protein n=1 Tax=Candidatus Sungiibacteriota bacterium TaxID=2750080 RepID=A0A933DRB4_9BACT|nr:four helix bundle protein [Candidatus Sungbacteria bacterium]